MNKLGNNMTSLRKKNRSAILQILYKEKMVSRKALADRIGLTASSITVLSREMINEKIIIESGEGEISSRAGRREILIGINYGYKKLIGVSIAESTVTVFIGTMDLRIIKSTAFPIEEACPAMTASDLIAQSCERLMEEVGVERNDILGISVVVVGKVDFALGVSVDSFGVLQSNAPLAQYLQNRMGMRVVLENNVRAMALAELIIDPINDTDGSMLFIRYDRGIGMVVIRGGTIYRGLHGWAGELGHIIVDPDGPVCRCGKNGCLEICAAMWSIRNKLKYMFSTEATPVLYSMAGGNRENITRQMILDAYVAGDSAVSKMINQAISIFSVSVSNMVTIFDPDRVTLSGHIFEIPSIIELMQKELTSLGISESSIARIGKSSRNVDLENVSPLAILLNDFLMSGGLIEN